MISDVSYPFQGGQPDISTVAKMVLNDWQRGKLPYFVLPPGTEVMVSTQYIGITIVKAVPSTAMIPVMT